VLSQRSTSTYRLTIFENSHQSAAAMFACVYPATNPQITKSALHRSIAMMLLVTTNASTLVAAAAPAACGPSRVPAARTGYSDEKKLQLAVKRNTYPISPSTRQTRRKRSSSFELWKLTLIHDTLLPLPASEAGGLGEAPSASRSASPRASRSASPRASPRRSAAPGGTSACAPCALGALSATLRALRALCALRAPGLPLRLRLRLRPRAPGLRLPLRPRAPAARPASAESMHRVCEIQLQGREPIQSVY
jgi:hypothetical protein